ncbi:MAG: carbon starvation protein A [Planctomycetes bacterium]|nr:carbon starvation protein A [Planctomycetota bacterium]
MTRVWTIAIWSAIACAGAGAFAVLALSRGETVSAAWMLVAAVCTYAIGYRFYSKIISHRIFALDDRHPTPAVRLEDGHDYVPTHKWVVFGHHFAAIAGAGPLVGPILAAQFGYLPGTIWIIVGVVLGGAAQDLIILCGSLRRDGKSLGQMAREEIGSIGGGVALVGVLAIIVILIAVLAMVVVNALAESPWAVVSLTLTIPIALLMGVWMRWIRPGRVLEASLIGLVLLGAALWAGGAIASSPYAGWFTLGKEQHQLFGGAVSVSGKELLAWGLLGYGFIASVLPVWLLLAPRDYLSAFVKVGTVFLLAAGILIVLPDLRMPALVSQFGDDGPFAHGHGPVGPGTLFPFAFITIACGAISGFHALVSSGTTPKMLSLESHARPIAYGSMLMESFVAIMALIAACALTPGVYFAMNSPVAIIGSDTVSAAAKISSWGFAIEPAVLDQLAADIGETTILSRTGGAPCLAVGMAQIFSSVFNGAGLAFWYHFAIMFEALFILTTIDAGTRVGRFLLQDVVGRSWKRFGSVSWQPAVWAASLGIVVGWGYFLIMGIRDPLGGIYTLWPVFGLANQVLAAIALCVGTAIIVKMGKGRFAWITVVPLLWLVVATETAGWQKVRSADPLIGFFAKARLLEQQVVALAPAVTAGDASAAVKAKIAGRQAFNQRLDGWMCIVFMAMILIVMLDTARSCWGHLRGGSPSGLVSPPEPQPSEAELREA